jgi:membrane fusion protein, multidrug efflux system
MNTRLFVMLFSLPLLACQKPVEPVAGPRPALVMTMSEAGAQTGSTLIGEVKARYESAQGFRVAGKITARKVEIGARVKKGQLLASLDSTDAHLAVQSTEADVAAAEAQFQLAQSNLERQRQLMAKKFISAAALDSYEAQYQSAKARLQQTRAQAHVSGNQSGYSQLYADRDGIVSFIKAEPGQVVSAGEVIANIVDPSQLEVQIALPESRVNKLAVQDAALVKLWANSSQTYQAKIREIAPVADPVTRTFLLKVSILNADSNLHLGMTAGVRFVKEQSAEILVPSPALVEWQQKPVVWLVDAHNKVHPQPVTVVSYREDGALISEGLKVGDQIVVAGAQALSPEQIVRPVAVHAAANENSAL